MNGSIYVKAIPSNPNEPVLYFESLTECCMAYGIRYEYTLKQLIEQGGLSPDGKSFFELPTDWELKDIEEGLITVIGPGRRRKRDVAKRDIRTTATIPEGSDSEGACEGTTDPCKSGQQQTEEPAAVDDDMRGQRQVQPM